MKGFAKALSVIIGLLDQCVGIVLALTLILQLDSVSVFYINGMTTIECLLFNTVIFTAILAGIGFAADVFFVSDKKDEAPVEFPVIYEALPVIVAGIAIFYSFQCETIREKITGTAMAALYALLSAVVIYFATKIKQRFPKEK